MFEQGKETCQEQGKYRGLNVITLQERNATEAIAIKIVSEDLDNSKKTVDQ